MNLKGSEMDRFLNFPFSIKAEGISENGSFEGYASTFGGKPDSYGDIIEQGAFKETILNGGKNGLGIQMLYQHDIGKPIGIWTEIIENSTGLKVKGQIAINTSLGKDVYELLKIGAIKALSIRFEPRGINAIEYLENNTIRKLKNLDLWEISLVTFPANTNATITQVKNAVESAKNERELEHALHGFGLSDNAAKYIVKLCKPSLVEMKNFEDREYILNEILQTLKKTNTELKDIKNEIGKE
jgi:uncharacterized protein